MNVPYKFVETKWSLEIQMWYECTAAGLTNFFTVIEHDWVIYFTLKAINLWTCYYALRSPLSCTWLSNLQSVWELSQRWSIYIYQYDHAASCSLQLQASALCAARTLKSLYRKLRNLSTTSSPIIFCLEDGIERWNGWWSRPTLPPFWPVAFWMYQDQWMSSFFHWLLWN